MIDISTVTPTPLMIPLKDVITELLDLFAGDPPTSTSRKRPCTSEDDPDTSRREATRLRGWRVSRWRLLDEYLLRMR